MRYFLMLAIVLSTGGCYVVAAGAAIDHVEQEQRDNKDKDAKIKELQERIDKLEKQK